MIPIIMSPWANLYREPTSLDTPEQVANWLTANKLRGKAEYGSGSDAIRVSTDEVPGGVTFQLPVPIGSLAWTFLGQP